MKHIRSVKRAIDNLFWILVLLMGLFILLIFSPYPRLNLGNIIIPKITKISVKFFLTTNATFIATVLAIFFSISLFTIQHAANNYTPSLLKDFKRDKQTWVVFLIFSACVVFNLSSLIFNWGLRSVCVSIILLIFCFIFLGFQFIHTINLIDPLELIKRIKDKAIKNISRLPQKLEDSMKEVKFPNEFEQYLIKSRLYKGVIFHSDKSLHEENKKYILQLTDIIQKSILRREYETCVAGFEAIADIVKEYVSIRQKDATPDDKFLQYIYEKLEAVSKIAFDNEDVSLLQEIIKTFEKIGSVTTKIEVISLTRGSNQITGLAGRYVHNIGSKAIEKKLWDVVSQSVRSLGEIGVIASQKNLHGNIAINSNSIREIGIKSISKGKWFIAHVANGELARLAVYSIRYKLNYFGAIVPIIKNIRELSVHSIENIILDSWDVEPTLSPIIGPLSEVSMKKMVNIALHIKNEEYPKIETHQREKYVKDIISEIINTLRVIGIKAVKARKGMIPSYVNEILRDIGIVCIKEDLEKEVITIANSLESIYMAFKDFSSSIPSEISESLAVLGIGCIENKFKKSISKIISNLFNMAIYTINFDKYGYNAPRIASKIVMIGIFALEKKDNSLAEKCSQSLIEFDTKYEELCSESKPQLHMKELEEEYKTFKDPYHATSDFYKWFFSKIQNKNLQKFKTLYEEKKKTGTTE